MIFQLQGGAKVIRFQWKPHFHLEFGSSPELAICDAEQWMATASFRSAPGS
jgi:hypothetical protein